VYDAEEVDGGDNAEEGDKLKEWMRKRSRRLLLPTAKQKHLDDP
jgi:hypothetical protein